MAEQPTAAKHDLHVTFQDGREFHFLSEDLADGIRDVLSSPQARRGYLRFLEGSPSRWRAHVALAEMEGVDPLAFLQGIVDDPAAVAARLAG